MMNLQMEWASRFVGGLSFHGVEYAVLSPGSRSTPLALAALSLLKCHVAVDERSAGFFALGQARILQRPVVLICTSGTAGAHYLPAIMEADLARIPLLILTADRPWADQDCGASQTASQPGMFGRFVRRCFELGEPLSGDMPAVDRISARAVLECRYPCPGPVHVNARLRTPVCPNAPMTVSPVTKPRVYAPVETPDPAGVSFLAAQLKQCSKGLIVCGPLHSSQDRAAMGMLVSALSRRLGFPAISGVTGPLFADEGVALKSGSLLLSSAEFRDRIRPDCIVEINGPLVTSAYPPFVAGSGDVRRFVLSPYGFPDPIGTAEAMCIGPVETLLSRVLDQLGRVETDSEWANSIATWDAAATDMLATAFDDADEFSEMQICCLLHQLGQGTLLVGNSLVIRDMDTFGGWNGHRVVHQRGLSGIDGLVSAAAGVACVSRRPVTLLIGDMAARHDVGGFALHREVTGPLITVIVNNDGGRIFQQLEMGQQEWLIEPLERAFVMSGAPSFEHAARMQGISWHRVTTPDAFSCAYEAALKSATAVVLEAVVTSADSRSWRKRLQDRLEGCLRRIER